MFIILLSLLLFILFQYVFAKESVTTSVEGPGCQGVPFQSALQIYLEFFAFIHSCLVLIFHLIVFEDHLKVVNSEFTSCSFRCINIEGEY